MLMKSLRQGLRKVLRDRGLAENKTIAWWYAEQQRKLEAGEEIEPPWITFPNSNPIYGWNQGYEEAWKLNIWTPFWRKMTGEEQNAYLERWHLPSEDWRETLTLYWTK